MNCIDVDALADHLDAIVYHDWNQRTSVSWADAFKVFAEMVRDERIVDAEPVRHGHWIEHEFGLMCSECGHYTEAMYDEPFNNEFGKGWAYIRPYYCGYCGAKMDETPNSPRHNGKSMMELERLIGEVEDV